MLAYTDDERFTGGTLALAPDEDIAALLAEIGDGARRTTSEDPDRATFYGTC